MPGGVSLWRTDVGPNSTASERNRAAWDLSLAKRIGEHLEKKYPLHHFETYVDGAGGIAQIKLPILPAGWGMVVKLSELNGDPGMRCIDNAAGELLERLNLPRGRLDRDRWREASTVTHRRLKHGLFDLQVNLKTGVARTVLPPELVR